MVIRFQNLALNLCLKIKNMKSLFTGVLLFFFSGSMFAQTEAEIVAKNIEAMGGSTVISKLETLIREGSISVQGMDLPITLTQKQNTGFRMDLNVMGTKGYQIYTPKKGWSYMPFQGNTAVEELSEEKVKDGQDDLDVQGILFNYKEKGNKVVLAGSETIEGADCFKLTVTIPNGLSFTYFIDKKTNFLAKVSTTRATAEGEKTAEVFYSDYKNVDGFMVAHKLSRTEGDLIFSKITVNGKVDDSIFKPEN
jgi:hypothetical protein